MKKVNSKPGKSRSADAERLERGIAALEKSKSMLPDGCEWRKDLEDLQMFLLPIRLRLQADLDRK